VGVTVISYGYQQKRVVQALRLPPQANAAAKTLGGRED